MVPFDNMKACEAAKGEILHSLLPLPLSVADRRRGTAEKVAKFLICVKAK